jgi:hypothetical protein
VEFGAKFVRRRGDDRKAARALAAGERQVSHNPAMAIRRRSASAIA